MSAQIINRTEAGFTVQITIPYNHSMLEFEETLQDRPKPMTENPFIVATRYASFKIPKGCPHGRKW